MQVLHVSFSRMGGAGEVATTLNNALLDLGVESRILTDSETNLWEAPLKNPVLATSAALDNFVMNSRKYPTYFSGLRSKLSNQKLEKEIISSEADVVHLHWVSGVVTRSGIQRILNSGKKIVWTLHDFYPFTAGCHHAFSCLQFHENCGACPQVKQVFMGIPREEFRNALERSKNQDGIVYVSPSNWLAGQAAKSALLRNAKLEIVPNPIEEIFFEAPSLPDPNTQLSGLDNIGVVIANDLKDANKDVSGLVAEVRTFNRPQTQKKLNLALIGSRGENMHAPRDGIHWLGRLEKREIVKLLHRTNAFVMTSRAESFSLATAEALAAGSFSFVRKNTAAEELILEGVTGATFNDYKDLLEKWANLGNRLNSVARPWQGSTSKHHPRSVAEQYLEIYKGLLGG